MIPLHWVNSLSLYFLWRISLYIVYNYTRGHVAECKWLTLQDSERKRRRRGVDDKERRNEMLKREIDQRRRRRRGEKCNVDPFVSSSTVGALTASCLYVTLCGPSQTWAFLSHTHTPSGPSWCSWFHLFLSRSGCIYFLKWSSIDSLSWTGLTSQPV